jgi:uncharacterized membrane protein YcaP (DUF421 family)
MENLLAIAVRVSVMYVFALALLRLAGKREIGAPSGPDVVATVIIGDMFDDIFWAEVSLAKGVVGLGTIIVLHIALRAIEWRSSVAMRVLDGRPALALLNGSPAQAGLRRERTRPDAIDELLRLQGIEHRSEAREARIETSGQLSVYKPDARKSAQRRDLPALKRAIEEAAA